MSLELKVIEKEIGSLAINYEELKKELSLQLKQFKGLVFGKEQITEAKQTRATLNKVKTVIDDRRKELKKEFLKPYEKVETQAKELVGMINDVNKEIDKQIKTFEEKEKEEKKVAIVQMWLGLKYNKITVDKIWNEKWLNKTVGENQIIKEMEERIEEIENTLEMFETLCAGDRRKAIDLQKKYLVSLDSKEILRQYNEEQKALEVLQKETTSEREVGVEELEEIIEIEDTTEEELEEEDLYELAFKVVGTRNQIIALEKFMKETKLKYKHIEIEKESE